MVARRSNVAYAAILVDVRKWVNDRDEDPQGNAIGAVRYSSGDIFDVVNYQIADMQQDAGFEAVGENILSETITYTEDAYLGMDLPSGIPSDAAIFLVETLRDTRRPTRLRMVGLTEIEDYSLADAGVASDGPAIADAYALVAARTGIGQRIITRPSGGLSLRVWYVANPLEIASVNDSGLVPFSARFREYIAVGAAARLLEPTGDITDSLAARLVRCEAQFQRFCSRLRANDSIRMEFPDV